MICMLHELQVFRYENIKHLLSFLGGMWFEESLFRDTPGRQFVLIDNFKFFFFLFFPSQYLALP